MTLFASNGNMAAFQGILGGCVTFYRERRRFEAFDRVAGRTFPAVCTSPESPLVGVFVAVRAFCKRHGGPKVSVRVAIGTTHLRMLA